MQRLYYLWILHNMNVIPNFGSQTPAKTPAWKRLLNLCWCGENRPKNYSQMITLLLKIYHSLNNLIHKVLDLSYCENNVSVLKLIFLKLPRSFLSIAPKSTVIYEIVCSHSVLHKSSESKFATCFCI